MSRYNEQQREEKFELDERGICENGHDLEECVCPEPEELEEIF